MGAGSSEAPVDTDLSLDKCEFITTHQHAQTKLKPSVKVEHLAHVTAASFSCSRHATCTALTDTDQSRHRKVGGTNPKGQTNPKLSQ